MITSSDRKFTSEIDYFKKNLSNAEQLRVMNDLKEIKIQEAGFTYPNENEPALKNINLEKYEVRI